MGIRHIDLHRLYQRVTEEGGYDLVSDTKAKPLMWRRFAEEFVGKNQYTTAQAFQMKNTYYKNLVSYEIKKHWGKEPPPKEIVEDVTAKGANVMSRTLENFERPAPKEQLDLQNGSQSDAASPEQKTPKPEQAEDGEGSGSATGGRTTRGLRQQPPQRVLFQPDLTASRQTRGALSGPQPSPTPGSGTNGGMHNSSLTNSASTSLASYEPSQSYPLTLKPVTTPGNNPEYYRNERKRKLEASAGELARKYRNIMLPGTGFIGPNIYVRAQLALQSGLAEEESFALHHLVKISHERGDKYRFDQFPGLAEALVRKALQISGLFYDVEWDVAYEEEVFDADDETLNGLGGTSNVLDKLRSHVPILTMDSVQDAETLSKRHRITEASLVIRNMCMLEHNAQYLSTLPLVRDYLAIALSLPHTESTVEMKHYALDTAEQVLKHSSIGPRDTLYQMLVEQLDSSDRGTLTIALRTISRIGDKLPMPKLLEGISPRNLKKVVDWLLIDDEELRSACLDFLSSYTSFSANVRNLLHTVDAEALARQLSRLLLFDAKEVKSQQSPEKTVDASDHIPAPVPRLSPELVQQLLALEEPTRSSEWLRMCFVSDPMAEMTQISLWQAYQGTFAPYQQTHPHLIAGEFIKNVSATFTGAAAQVAGANKYVIKGIKSRKIPVNGGLLPGTTATEKGKELYMCQWYHAVPVDGPRDPITGAPTGTTTQDAQCSEWFRDGKVMLEHILSSHLGIPKAPSQAKPQTSESMDIDGTIPNPAPGTVRDWLAADKTTHNCRWADTCPRSSTDFSNPPETSTPSNIPRTLLFARHIQTHLPDSSSHQRSNNITPDTKPTPIETAVASTYTTLTDDAGDAAGVPLGASVVLRNLARFFPVTEAEKEGFANGLTKGGAGGVHGLTKGSGSGKDSLARIFDGTVLGAVLGALADNTVLRREVDSILRALGKVERG